jgi:acetyltransferase-like isoleucine patch superfamily enzyme
VGDYSVLNPGVTIHAGDRVEIGRNAILAPNVRISDTDWHGAYDRVYDNGGHAPIVLRDNVWIGEGAMVAKGVTIGRNAIVGARALVTRDVPDYAVVAGNPARVVRELDPEREFLTREHLFDNPQLYFEQLPELERAMLGGNSMAGWLRYLLLPRRGD